MNWLGRVASGVGTLVLTGSPAGALTAAASNNFFAGMGMGVLDNMSGRMLSYGMGSCWNGCYGYGGFYGMGYPMMDYSMMSMYSNPFMFGGGWGSNWGWGF